MTLLFTFPEQEALARQLNAPLGKWEWRHFPDGESYVRVKSDVHGKTIAMVCSLDRPDVKLLPLIFLAKTLKELGASRITLIAPYLGYMRQDTRFKTGEAVTSEIFASLLAPYLDALITIDPHLHRHARLEEIYPCECKILNAAPLMAAWIAKHVSRPVLIGPDMESEQWVKTVAEGAQAPYVILQKTRHGDRDVEMALPGMQPYANHTPVIVDDIVSTAGTMIKTVALLQQQQFASAICLATHGLFAGDAYMKLIGSGAEVITTNTVSHESNAIDVTGLFASLVQ